MILSKDSKKINNKFILSRYFRHKKKGNKVAIFHELQPFFIFIRLKEWNFFLKKKRFFLKTFEKLKKINLILSSAKEDDLFFRKVLLKFNKKLNKTFILYLVLTKNCNYSCSYCPFKNDGILNKKINNLMSKEILISGINLWRKHVLENLKNKNNYFKNYFIIFYGGEPLLNLKTIKYGLMYIDKLKKKKQLPEKLKLLISTNGSLINNETIKILKRHNVMITVGLDGTNINQNTYRIKEGKLNSFQDSIDIIKKLIKNKINTSVSITITPTIVPANQISDIL